MELSSFSNPKIKLIRKLQEKKQRYKNGLYYIEGLRIIGDALQHHAAFDAVYYAPELLRSQFGLALIQQCRENEIEVYEVPAVIFEHFSLKDHPQGIGAVMKMQPQALPADDMLPRRIWVGLDAVADPGNLGTILRTQDATDGSGIFLLGNCVDPYDTSVILGRMGAVFTQPFYSMDAADFRAWKQAHQVPVIGTSDAAKQDYQSITYPSQMVLLMGSEREGLHPEMEALCDEIVSIPMSGYSDSLNLSIATAVVLYEIYNQHRKIGIASGGKK
jgi:TrmH family RNA methyltransferase